LISYREPTREELTLLRRSFDHWGIFDFVLDKEILIREKRYNGTTIKEVYLTTKDNSKFLSENTSLSHIGMLIGHLKRRSFVPSMAGADLISRVGVNFPYVTVNQTAEALVLYGRDIMYASVVDYRDLCKNNTIVIILNEKRVAIGLGITTVPIDKNSHIVDNRIVIKTIVDSGNYLRNERCKDRGMERNKRTRQKREEPLS
jgi:ribosome biogenesis protein Nip4